MSSLDITPGTWAVLDRLLDQALDLPETEREPWLARLGPEDAVHADRLRALLAGAAAGSPLDALPCLEAPPEAPPDTIGPYHLLRRLGEGGMGSVWLAERRDVMVRRPVALKLPRLSWQGDALAQRLAREREILAALDHPNIARLLDAGVTADGHPYLALEYVEGQPIDVHARERRLSLRARLELFRQVLAAVGHAHGRLVVHRDLKPSNVLVTDDGQVRLLDFGIAKLVAEHDGDELTQLTGLAFTPSYASPEQLAGRQIGVASDIYSLGILLYELLAEAPPYRLRRAPGQSLHDALRAVAIARPSERAATPAMRKGLAGDLDTIVLAAIKPSPDERYPTANAFADDISRFLAGYPITARADSAWYRMRKLVLRNRAAAAAVAAVVLALAGGVSAALWQARRATDEQHRAEQVAGYLTDMLRDASPYGAAGRSPSVVDLLKRAHAGLDRVGARPDLRVELLNLLGQALLDLGDNDAGERVARQALAEAAALPADHVQRLRARLLETDVLYVRGRSEDMRTRLDQLVPLLERDERDQPGDLVRALQNRTKLATLQIRGDDALRDAQRGFDLALARLGDRDERTVGSAVLLAEVYQYVQRGTPRALREAEHGLAFAARAYADQPDHPHVISARNVFANALCQAGQPDRASAEANRALRDATAVLGPNSPLVGEISISRVACGRRLGYLQQAIDDATRGIVIRDTGMQRDSRSWGNSHTARGITLVAARRPAEALDDLTPAAEALARALGERHWLTLVARVTRMTALAFAGRAAEADGELRALEAIRPDLPPQCNFDANSGTVHRLAGRFADARDAYQRALAAVADGGQRDAQRLRLLTELGQTQVALGDLTGARSSLDQALALSATEQRVDTPLRAEAWVALARTMPRPAEALPLLERADAFWRGFDADNRWGADAAGELARCYRQLGRTADAARADDRARRLAAIAPDAPRAPN